MGVFGVYVGAAKALDKSIPETQMGIKDPSL